MSLFRSVGIAEDYWTHKYIMSEDIALENPTKLVDAHFTFPLEFVNG